MVFNTSKFLYTSRHDDLRDIIQSNLFDEEENSLIVEYRRAGFDSRKRCYDEEKDRGLMTIVRRLRLHLLLASYSQDWEDIDLREL